MGKRVGLAHSRGVLTGRPRQIPLGRVVSAGITRPVIKSTSVSSAAITAIKQAYKASDRPM